MLALLANQGMMTKKTFVFMASNLFYAQSGGVTAVINASASAVIQTAREFPDHIGSVFAGRNGILGALHEELIDTSHFSSEQVAALAHTPGGAFGSCRYKLHDPQRQKEAYQRLVDVFAAHEIRYFLYNGGGDSQDTANKVSQISHNMGYPIQCIGVPKTIDNDLAITDNCPGFGSVAKYVAISTLEASLDVAAMAESSTKVFILEVMGRHAGWIAAAAALAQSTEHRAPHVILLPEVEFQEAAFMSKVRKAVQDHGYCVVVASEGVRENGTFLSAQGTQDAFGHAQLGGVAASLAQRIKDQLGFKYHYAIADYLQRSARHIAAQTDVDQAFAVGAYAVRALVAGKSGIMPVIRRLSESPYQWDIGEAPLSEVANVEKTLPEDFISDDGMHVTEACKQYLAPLIQGEAYPPYHQGIPKYQVFHHKMVDKKLPEYPI
jgi:6-phosphofructokinase